jgi:hypothetical protein
MLMFEELARSRSRELQQRAYQHRLGRRLLAGRFWQRLADYANYRAARARQ